MQYNTVRPKTINTQTTESLVLALDQLLNSILALRYVDIKLISTCSYRSIYKIFLTRGQNPKFIFSDVLFTYFLNKNN